MRQLNFVSFCLQVLLIRQPRYPPGMFSCVAGFVDAGETLFECVQVRPFCDSSASAKRFPVEKSS
jgi:hypothetical protein